MGQVGRFARVFTGGGEFPSDGVVDPLGKVEMRGEVPESNEFLEVVDRKTTRDVKLENPCIVGRCFAAALGFAFGEVEYGGSMLLGERPSAQGASQKLALLPSPIVTVVKA